MNLDMKNKYILVKTFEKANVSKGGIILPDIIQQSVEKGRVVSRPTVADVNVGDVIMFYASDASKIDIDGVEHCILKNKKIIAVLIEDAPTDEY